jgi:hypothetical protein
MKSALFQLLPVVDGALCLAPAVDKTWKNSYDGSQTVAFESWYKTFSCQDQDKD